MRDDDKAKHGTNEDDGNNTTKLAKDVTTKTITKDFSYLERISEWRDVIVQTIFELEKKYAHSLKQKVVIDVRESEKDRSKVSEAYLYLQELAAHNLDARLYLDFVDMFELREGYLTPKEYSLEQQLWAFSKKVRMYCQPIITVIPRRTIQKFIGISHKSKEELITEKREEIVNFIERYSQLYNCLKSRSISSKELKEMEEQLLKKLTGKAITKEELEKSLSPYEAEILSKLISEKKLILVKKGELIVIQKKKDDIGIPSAILLVPNLTSSPP